MRALFLLAAVTLGLILPGPQAVGASAQASNPPAAVVPPPGPTPPAPQAGVAAIVGCAEARHAWNVKTVAGYTVRVQSARQGYTLEGKLEEDFRIAKTVLVTPTSREETFEKGSKNGSTAEMDDFWLEKLGLSKKYNAEAMNLFTPENRGRYEYALRSTESLAGRPAWRLSYKVKEEGSQELQKGTVWLDQASCAVMKAEGNFPKLWVTEKVTAELKLMEVQPGLWLPQKQVVDLEVSMPMMRRKAKMVDEFSAYQVKVRK